MRTSLGRSKTDSETTSWQLKARMQTSGETLQEFAAAVEQLMHQVIVGLPVGYIQT
jgi:hypothetical protein